MGLIGIHRYAFRAQLRAVFSHSFAIRSDSLALSLNAALEFLYEHFHVAPTLFPLKFKLFFEELKVIVYLPLLLLLAFFKFFLALLLAGTEKTGKMSAEELVRLLAGI